MRGCARYFVIAGSLTILNAVVTVYYGLAIWKARPEDIWGCGPLVLFAALGTASPANVWVQAVLGSGVSPIGRSDE